ncbi:NAD(P)/FAD-dependent oxidoreductase [Quadrisphaera sp. DSM 44207]|uniref:NAD(P)/FAD-dependent oxidoreductase n=1 Tax=Quadrisphaera sp. DSM 44207 TaxID=1881057 RepID=UPI000889E4CB|nr:geranylgeranyl reductase family protein [Quadrisphaera sp. DSM 44207]SDQ34336.1 geranylgeranyl reductase family [Quadrisphaera sp. DSM 44207]
MESSPEQPEPTRDEPAWDVVVVGAGPAGAATALGALTERPGARVLLLDRADFPRDKVCGDGVAPHALDVLAEVGVHGLLDDWPVAPRLRIGLDGGPVVEQVMQRPSYVVPREVFDARLVAAAVERGAVLRRQRVRSSTEDAAGVVLDDGTRGRVLVGADGAHSVVRRALHPGQRPGTTAIALRGYGRVRPEHDGVQVLAFAARGRRPCYAWSFPIGDGRANVGYGELVPPGPEHPTRAHLLARLEELLPGTTADAEALGGHPLPLSTGRPPSAGRGRVLLVGDAASLVNPVTGEGIYYAVLSGVLAGRAAAASLQGSAHGADGGAAGAGAGERYAAALRAALGSHLRHTDVAQRLVRSDQLLAAALRAADRDQGVFDDLADIGLARGHLTGRVVRGLARELVRPTSR